MSSATSIALMGALVGCQIAHDGPACSELPEWAQIVYLVFAGAYAVALVSLAVMLWRFRP